MSSQRQYKSIVFSWTYELKFEEFEYVVPHNINKNKQTCRPCKGQNKMAVTLEVGQLLRVKRKNLLSKFLGSISMDVSKK